MTSCSVRSNILNVSDALILANIFLKYALTYHVLISSPPPHVDSKGLSNPTEVEALRERVYASLEAYCKQKYPDQPGR